MEVSSYRIIIYYYPIMYQEKIIFFLKFYAKIFLAKIFLAKIFLAPERQGWFSSCWKKEKKKKKRNIFFPASKKPSLAPKIGF